MALRRRVLVALQGLQLTLQFGDDAVLLPLPGLGLAALGLLPRNFLLKPVQLGMVLGQFLVGPRHGSRGRGVAGIDGTRRPGPGAPAGKRRHGAKPQ